MRTLRALVLSGGGSKIAFQAGVIQILLESGQPYDVIAGVSCGSLAGAVLAQGPGSQQPANAARLVNLILDIKDSGAIYDGGFLPTDIVRLFKTGALYNPKGLQKLLAEAVDLTALRRTKTQYRAGMVGLQSGRYVTVANGVGHLGRPWEEEVSREAILASSSMPGFFPAVEINGDYYVDGGVRDITPMDAAFQALRDLLGMQGPADVQVEMDVVICSPLAASRQRINPRAALQVLPRSIGLLENEVFRDDIKGALLKNANPAFLKANIRVYQPTTVFQGTLEFKPEKMGQTYMHGRQRALQPLTGEDLNFAVGITPWTWTA